MKMKKCLGLMSAIGILVFQVGCGQFLNATVGGNMETPQNTVAAETSLYEITEADRNTRGDNPIDVTLEEIPDGLLQITEAGTYRISGNTSNGKIIISVDDDQIVHLILNGIELHSEDGAAIYVENAAKVVITLAEGTENTIADSVNYNDAVEACIFSNCDLTINGSGRLNAYGYFHDAIRSKDSLKILNTNLFVKAKNNGVRGNDGVVIEDSIVDIQSEGIGIKTISDKDFVVIRGGECKIIAGENAICSENYVLIEGCVKDFHSVEEVIRCNGEKHINEM